MAEASLLHVAESLLVKLSPYAFKEIKSWWGAKDDLQRLVSSIRIIKAGLLDAEKRQEGRDREGKLVKEWLRRLRNVLYDADDLFDEVITIEESKQTPTRKEKFAQLFSKSSPALFLADIAGKIKKIRKELDGIKSDMGHFTFDHGLSEKTICFDRETGSVESADNIIGREEEEKELMGILLDAKSKEEGSADVIAIVGFGGLGKTTLAQLLYNNAVVKENFDLCAWACILDTKGTTSKARIILDALQTAEKSVHHISVNKLQLEIQRTIQKKKYLLVLDDFWDEDRQTWLYLKGLLRGGETGSKILVTTRSSNVARAMGVEFTHDLKGLKDDKAWELFKRLAFRSAADAENQSLIMMGKEIIKKCQNVPLAIKAIASLLYTLCDNEREWKSIMDSDMLTLERKHENVKILPVLKLSYDHLPSHLKHCFAYCSLYPKGCGIEGDKLVHHWIAQGYVVDSSERGHCGLQEIGVNYLAELVSRLFLQHTGYGKSYIMHDLIHDLAQEMAGEEVFVANRGNCKVKERDKTSKDVKIRHLSFSGIQIDDELFTWTRENYLRSLVHVPLDRENLDCFISEAMLKKLALRFTLLRLLDLGHMGLISLPSSVGELKHLRCLILCYSLFTHLPDTITKLHNLKILDVSYCHKLEVLPANFKRLKNLCCLKVRGCGCLTSMPCKIEELPSLESQDRFIIRESWSELEAHARFFNNSGFLSVEYLNVSGGCIRKEGDEEEMRVDLSSSLVHLDELNFRWPYDTESGWEGSSEFECSQLPSNLKTLDIRYFPGQKLPEWKKSFNNLVAVTVHSCRKCRYLPSFGQHPRLRYLTLWGLDELEYIQLEMEEDDELVAETYFPCLEYLWLGYLQKLKAWSPGMEKRGLQHISSSAPAVASPRFCSLINLWIANCPELMSIPLPPEGKAVWIISDVVKEPLHTLLGTIK